MSTNRRAVPWPARVPSRRSRRSAWCRRLLAASALLAVLTPLAAAADAAALAALDRDLEALRTKLRIPALAVVLVDSERVLLSKTYGVADRASGEPFGPTHYFRIGSITKTFTALATLRLVAEGRLALADRLQDIAPGLPVSNPWQDTDPITIEQLLEHTAGLNDLSLREFGFNEPLPRTAAFALSPDSRTVRWPPGLHHSYSNNSPGLVAAAIERVTGMPFEACLRRAVLEPLGMDAATLLPEPEVLARLVTGYNSDRRTVIPYWHMTYPAFGALNVRPAEMAAFLQLFLNRGRHDGQAFLAPALMDRMEAPRTTLAAGSGLDFGYGLGLYAFLHGDHLFHGHGGDADGYLSRFAYQKQAGLAYYVGINVFRREDLTRVRRRVEDYIVAGLPAVQAPLAKLPDTALAARTGDYEAVTWRFPNAPATEVTPAVLSVVQGEAGLLLRRPGKTDRVLAPVTASHFRFADEPLATMAFIEHEGALYLQMDGGNYRRRQTAGPGEPAR